MNAAITRQSSLERNPSEEEPMNQGTGASQLTCLSENSKYH